MLQSIKRFFDDRIAGLMQGEGMSAEEQEHRLQLATAALMLEVARADRVWDDLELDEIQLAVGRCFDLSREDANALIDLADDEVRNSTSHYGFTSLINAEFQPEQKVKLVEMLWRVAFADGQLDKYEENLVRRVSDLIHVPHKDFIAAKLRVTDGGGRVPG